MTHDISSIIGLPEGPTLEYKVVLPPAITVAQLICGFANYKGGTIILGVQSEGKSAKIVGLSDEFRAAEITRKAVDLLTPRPETQFRYQEHKGKRLFVISVLKSSTTISLGGKQYFRNDAGHDVVGEQPHASASSDPVIAAARAALEQEVKGGTAAKVRLLDHFRSVISIINELQKSLFSDNVAQPPIAQEGRVLMRVLFSTCADCFEIYMSDLLLEIYLARPETLKSSLTVTVEEVLACGDIEEFIEMHAKQKIAKLQRGSVKGFISENKQIRDLSAISSSEVDGIEKLLQIRHLFTHRNGVVDEKFQKYFPQHSLNDEYMLSVEGLLQRCRQLIDVVSKVDAAARSKYQLSSFS